jgi:hypothetical protein
MDLAHTTTYPIKDEIIKDAALATDVLKSLCRHDVEMSTTPTRSMFLPCLVSLSLR